MTKPLAECRACGRIEGHYIGCANSPRPKEVIVPAFEPLAEDATCQEDECEEPAKNAASKYCDIHGTTTAAQARAYRKRKEAKEITNG